jgi:Bacterial self-protective colicin-like immunity
MSDVYSDYRILLNRFVEGAISPEEFQSAYLSRFKNEDKILDEPLFDLLDSLFGDVDAFTNDLELLTENPGFYLDEVALREKTAQALKKLAKIETAYGG